MMYGLKGGQRNVLNNHKKNNNKRSIDLNSWFRSRSFSILEKSNKDVSFSFNIETILIRKII